MTDENKGAEVPPRAEPLAPPPPTMEDLKKQVEELSRSKKVDEEVAKSLAIRRWTGLMLGGLGLVWTGGSIVGAFRGGAAWLPEDVSAPVPLALAFVSHAVPFVAAIWFGYQLLRAGERMLVPHTWVAGASHPDSLRTILGLTHAPKLPKEFVELLTSAVKGTKG